MDTSELKQLLKEGNPAFWESLAAASCEALDFGDLFLLSSLRKKAHARGLIQKKPMPPRFRLAMVGGYSLYPLHELIEHLLEVQEIPCELWLGAYDNYISEIMDEESELHAFKPQAVLVLPSASRCRYPGSLTDSVAAHRAEAHRIVDSLIDLALRVHDTNQAEVILSNFMLPARHDLGPYRTRSLGSDWSFRKCVNLELGLRAPSYLHICDLEYLTHRHGGLNAHDERAWFETKQPCSSGLLVELAREAAHLVTGLRRPPKKVLVLDLDNTLWGGVIADDGMEGIELGDTSARGEAFKSFQRYIRSLKDRGTLLAVCSKNDLEKAMEPFESHPEMVLRMSDIVSFKANWEPKSENIRNIASELNLGLDSLVFVDDNPAEIEIVRQFVPEVSTILLGPDPALYVSQLQDCRLFEPKSITAEDAERTRQYRTEAERHALLASVTDMGSYLESLQMEATISTFAPVDMPRVSQLINKSNQFNLTTRRRSEADLLALKQDSAFIGFSTRLTDRFGDHGLISVVIGRIQDSEMEIDTWLMSCRVLKRQVEDEVLNDLVRIARSRGCSSIRGIYVPTPKNEMVRDFYPRMGFTQISTSDERSEFILSVPDFTHLPTRIHITHLNQEP
jgi:FkbH-like protein